MNVLLVGPYYGNAKHGAEVGIYNALKELDCNVSVWDYRVGSYLTAEGVRLQTKSEDGVLFEIIKNDSCDIVLCPGAGLPDEVLNSPIWKKYKDCLKILWNSEPIRLESYRAKVEKQKKHFQVIFTFDESEIPLYREIGINAAWLPQAFNPEWYKPILTTPNQRFDGYLVFIGSVGGKWLNRSIFLDRVRKLGHKVNSTTIFDAERVNKAYNMHEAVLNLGLYIQEAGPPEKLIGFGLQQRIFETIGAGKVCITNQIDGATNKLFTHGENILFYNSDNLGEVLEIVKDKEHMKKMEENIDCIRGNHCYKARIQRLLDVIDW